MSLQRAAPKTSTPADPACQQSLLKPAPNSDADKLTAALITPAAAKQPVSVYYCDAFKGDTCSLLCAH